LFDRGGARDFLRRGVETMPWTFPDFGRLPFISAVRFPLHLPINLLTLNTSYGSSSNSPFSFAMAADGDLGSETETADPKGSSDTGDGSSSDPPAYNPSSDDPLHHEPMEHYQPEPLRSDDSSRVNRATGVLDDLDTNDRTCPADGSTALGPNDARSREVHRFLQSLQDEDRQPKESSQGSEIDPSNSRAGVRCTPSGNGCRTGFFAHALGDSTQTDLSEPIQRSAVDAPAEPPTRVYRPTYGRTALPPDDALAAYGQSRLNTKAVESVASYRPGPPSTSVPGGNNVPGGGVYSTRSDPERAVRSRLGLDGGGVGGSGGTRIGGGGAGRMMNNL
jgi:hypothetical protein